MSKGIANFLERTSHNTENNYFTGVEEPQIQDAGSSQEIEKDPNRTPERCSTPAQESVLDKIRQTLDHAADILRESLELVVGGVVFLDTASGYSDNETTDAYPEKSTGISARSHTKIEDENLPENIKEIKVPSGPHNNIGSKSRLLSSESTRSSDDKHKATKVLAMSAAKIATWDPESNVLDAKTLQSFIHSYPKGNVWYVDEQGYFSSLDQVNDTGRRKSVAQIDLARQETEATLLSKIFHKARQLIFLPLWDAGAGKPHISSSQASTSYQDLERWYSGCFVWSQSAVPVFTVESEIAYLSAYTNSVMVEISRLDAITSSKMKSNFISSISRELLINFLTGLSY